MFSNHVYMSRELPKHLQKNGTTTNGKTKTNHYANYEPSPKWQ